MKKAGLVVGVTALLLVGAPSALAADTQCTGLLVGVHDNVIVPEGQMCTLAGAQVQGSVLVRPGARLNDVPATTNLVHGSLTSDRATAVELQSTRVLGNVELKMTSSNILLGAGFSVDGNLKLEQGARVLIDSATVGGEVEVVKIMAGVESVEVRNTVVGGKLTVIDSIAGTVAVTENQVEGGLAVQNNVADIGGLAVDDNRVVGNLEVKNNNVPDTTPTAVASVSLNDVDSNLVIDNNLIDTAQPFTISANQVDDNMFVTKNRGSTTKEVTLNVVAETLGCFDNDQPFIGGPNLANDAQGQCF